MEEKLIDTEKMKGAAKEAAGKVEEFVSEKTVSKESRLWGAVCYILAVIVPLIVLLTEKKKDVFVAFHAYQSLMLCGGSIAYYILLSIVSAILAFITPLLSLLLLPFYLVPMLVHLLMAWKAYQGKRFRLPVAGDRAMDAAKRI